MLKCSVCCKGIPGCWLLVKRGLSMYIYGSDLFFSVNQWGFNHPLFALASYLIIIRRRISMKSSRVAIAYCLTLLKIVFVLIYLTGAGATLPISPEKPRLLPKYFNDKFRHMMWINLSWRLKKSCVIHNTGPQDPIYPVNGFCSGPSWDSHLSLACIVPDLWPIGKCSLFGQRPITMSYPRPHWDSEMMHHTRSPVLIQALHLERSPKKRLRIKFGWPLWDCPFSLFILASSILISAKSIFFQKIHKTLSGSWCGFFLMAVCQRIH